MIKKFFCSFLVLNLIVLTLVYASECSRNDLLSKTKELYRFITEKIDSGHSFNDSLKDQIVEYTASIVGVNDFNEQYKVIRAAMRNRDKFDKKYNLTCNCSDNIVRLLNTILQDLKTKHPEIKAEKTVMFSQVSTFISKTEVDDAVSNAGGGSVFASSMIEEDTTKSKKNKSSYEQLMAQNNLLSMLVENFKKEKSELMDKQVELSAENGGLKERVASLEKQLQDTEELRYLNSLYKQVVGIYQKIVKSKPDFEQIIKLMKQIEGKKDEK